MKYHWWRGLPVHSSAREERAEAPRSLSETNGTRVDSNRGLVLPPGTYQPSKPHLSQPVTSGSYDTSRKTSQGVVADVYRAKQEGRRPSDKQQRQGCAELRLYCRRWNSLRIGPDGLLTMSLAAKHRQPAKERVICPAAIRRELIRDTHQQTHTGVQGVLTELQLRWHWPHMGRDIRCRVRQCETSQANKHGRPPGEAGRRMRNAEGPWQAETVALVENMITTPQEDVARQERPLPSLEVRPPPPALTLPRPLPESDTDPEVQNPPPGGRGFVQRH